VFSPSQMFALEFCLLMRLQWHFNVRFGSYYEYAENSCESICAYVNSHICKKDSNFLFLVNKNKETDVRLLPEEVTSVCRLFRNIQEDTTISQNRADQLEM
jgi:hypothetical protein